MLAYSIFRNVINTRYLNKVSNVNISLLRYKSTEFPTNENPRIIKRGFNEPRDLLRQELYGEGASRLKVPSETDICIVGGGLVGLATAYWLKKRHPNGFMVTIIEKDPSYSQASSVLSAGGIRQQFSLTENIQMSMFTSEFFRDLKDHLSVMDHEPPDIQYNPQGYLFMASEKGSDVLKQNHALQTSLGAKVQLMSSSELEQRFPWMNTEGIELANYGLISRVGHTYNCIAYVINSSEHYPSRDGLQNEGWFDPWLLIAALKIKLASWGTRFVTGEVVGFHGDANPNETHRTINYVEVKTDDNYVQSMCFATCVNAGGPWARDIARLAGIGTGEGILSQDLPVEPRFTPKRYVYLVHCPDAPGLDMPFLIDPTGVYIRREGLAGNYICGASPESVSIRIAEDEEPDHSNLDVDHEFFEQKVWHVLAHRCKAFESLKVKSSWAGYYDYNYFDQNLIIGNHPYHRNMIFANGSSGHGIQHAISIGRATSELILDDEFTTIDLKRMNFDRVILNQPIFEDGIV